VVWQLARFQNFCFIPADLGAGRVGNARSHMERLRRWVLGEYTVQLGTDAAKVNMDAAIGLVEWQAGETMREVLGRADTAMYQQKAVAHQEPPTSQMGRES
jgi:PleD family two-component response regulator